MMAKKSLLGAVALACQSLFMAAGLAKAQSIPTDRPANVAILGDSVTRGVMADAELGKPNARFYTDMLHGQVAVNFLSVIGKIFGMPAPTNEDIDFLDKNFGHMSRLNLSAFFGSQSYSLPKRLEYATSWRPRVFNGALLASGYLSSDIALSRLEKQQRSILRMPQIDVVVVNYNGMDFMHKVKLEQFEKYLNRFFTRLKKMAPSAIVFVTDLSNPIVLLTAPDRLAAPKNVLMPKGLTCHDMYKQLQFGGEGSLTPDSSPEEIAVEFDRLTAMRAALRNKVDSLNSQYDEGKVVLVENIMREGEIDPVTMLSADCIHPYVTGHKLIGDELWNTVSDYL